MAVSSANKINSSTSEAVIISLTSMMKRSGLNIEPLGTPIHKNYINTLVQYLENNSVPIYAIVYCDLWYQNA